MCCSPNREAVRAAAHYHTRAWQTLIYGKERYIVIVIYLPFKHKQSQIILFNCMQNINRKRQYYRRTYTKLVKKTEFLIAISRLTGDKWQSKTLVVAISDPRSSIVRQEFSIAAYPVWKHFFYNWNMKNVNYSQ